MQSPSSPMLSRRQLLVGGAAAAGAVLLGACGGDDAAETKGGEGAQGMALAQFFGGGPMFVAGEESRLPFGVADEDGLLPIDRTPTALTVQILDPSGTAVGDAIEVERHADGLPRAYFPLRARIDRPGIHTARTEIEGVPTEMAFQVHTPVDVTVIRPGASLPPVDTPTVSDGHGVDPICTNDPVCPLHDVTLGQAIAEGGPIALLVATPAFCQVEICGPVLDVLLDVRAGFPGVRFIHAEVYAEPARDITTYAPLLERLGLQFEPCLILAGAGGVVTERIDTIYDRTELRARLERLA